MLVKAERWVRETFAEGSHPDIRTVKRWVTKGVIAGVIIDTSAFIDSSEFARDIAKQSTTSTKNPDFLLKDI